jgi:hypothetical protein
MPACHQATFSAPSSPPHSPLPLTPALQDLTFSFSFESMNVNRGSLYARLESGTYIVTAHIAPGPAASGPLAEVSEILNPKP